MSNLKAERGEASLKYKNKQSRTARPFFLTRKNLSVATLKFYAALFNFLIKCNILVELKLEPVVLRTRVKN